jgi:hypothetical protein
MAQQAEYRRTPIIGVFQEVFYDSLAGKPTILMVG